MAAAGAGVAGYRSTRPDTHLPLHAETIAWTAPGERAEVPVGQAGRLVPGSRVLRDARDRDALLAQERSWWQACSSRVRTDPRWSSLAQAALLDLNVLTLPSGVTVAGWTRQWRYLWPRDGAHTAVALGLCGYREQARAQWRQLAGLPRVNGEFEARYRLDLQGPPDDRPRQLDGLGWFLWCTGLLQRIGVLDRAEVTGRAADVRAVATSALVQLEHDLPGASPDYWEVDEDEVTLGTVAPLLAGLDRIRTALRWVDPALAARVDRALPGMRARVESEFGEHGYQRYADHGGPDTAVCFLLPPYTSAALTGALPAARSAVDALRQPGGGVTPGDSWKDDGISWTPETAVFAGVFAASDDAADHDRARGLLRWLDTHRTAGGSLPEKVLRTGRPASVAPLAWTDASTLIAIAALDDSR